MNRLFWLALSGTLFLAGCSNSNDDTSPNPGGPPGAAAVVSGTLTYDLVPHTNQNALDYGSIVQQPIRGATVQLLDSNSNVIDSARSNSNGEYQLNTNVNVAVRVRVLAELLQSSTASWDVTVVDNTNNKAVYAVQGDLVVVDSTAQTRNLNAASGWGGSSYTSTRSAAPFAILDSVYQAVQTIVAVDPDVTLPTLELNWSVNNVPSPGDVAQGQISTSYYSNGNIYILGAANTDTDEYDDHVIVHEWGHYFEDRLARSDSIGGSHSGGQRIDPRVAFGEGWGNAWSGIALADPVYRDSYGASQGSGFSINVESNNNTNPGWYSESSVQSIIYDVFDSTNDGQDTLSLGFAPIYEVLVGSQRTTDAFTSIFSFARYLKDNNAAAAAQISALLDEQQIEGDTIDIFGSTETNNAGNATYVLPVYTEMQPGSSVQICSTNSFGTAQNYEYNGLGARRYIRLNIGASAAYNFSMVSTNNSGDPDIYVFNQGQQLNCVQTSNGCSDGVGSETFSLSLSAGTYVIDAHDYLNTDNQAGGGNNCFNFSVTPN